jgi:hypothetical protein
MLIDVGARAFDPENDPLIYAYTITGGRIVGSGSQVKWDLSGVYPGTYTITAGVDEGFGVLGKTQTRSVAVEACDPTCGLCSCATVELTGPINGINSSGDNAFTANVIAGTYDPTYEWIVDGGTVVTGQGTPAVSVQFNEKALNSKASVTVRIGGASPICACPVEYSVEFLNSRRKA